MDKNFNAEFDRIFTLIKSKTPIACGRYADGEIALMQGRKIGDNSQALKVDRWSSLADGITQLGVDLRETLYHTEPEYFYAISCKCCDPDGHMWIINELKQNPENITYSNLWINDNYKHFIYQMDKLNEDVYLVCNKRGIDGMYPFDVCGLFSIEDDCVNYWNNNREIIINSMHQIATEYNNTLYFISAGPLSEVLIHYLWIANPTNRYIDVGSAIDEFVHCKKTRPFMIEGTPYFNVKCHF